MSAFDPLRKLAVSGRLSLMDAIPTEEEEAQRRHWRLLWLSSIQAFSDSETQRTRWLDPTEKNPYYSLVECMCGYFDDAYLSETDAYAKRVAVGNLTEEEVAAVAEFHALAERYESPTGDNWNSEAVLEDPRWQAVVNAAQNAQAQLLPLLTDPSEKEALIQPMHWREQNGAFHADLIGSFIVLAGGSSFGKIVRGLRRKLFG